jgi:hypothetical protein
MEVQPKEPMNPIAQDRKKRKTTIGGAIETIRKELVEELERGKSADEIREAASHVDANGNGDSSKSDKSNEEEPLFALTPSARLLGADELEEKMNETIKVPKPRFYQYKPPNAKKGGSSLKVESCTKTTAYYYFLLLLLIFVVRSDVPSISRSL